MYYYADEPTIRGEYVLEQIGEDFEIYQITAFEEKSVEEVLEKLTFVASTGNIHSLQDFLNGIDERAYEIAMDYAGIMYADNEEDIPDIDEED